MSTWFQSVKKAFFGDRGKEKQRLSDDAFGFSVPDKPRFLLSPIFEKLIAKTSIPEDQQKLLETLAEKGCIIYALRHRSQLDFVYVSLRLHQLGLPTPTFLFDLRPYFWQPRTYATAVILRNLVKHLSRDGVPDPYEHGYYRDRLHQGRSGLLFLLGKKGYYQRTVMVQHDPLDHLLTLQKEISRPIYVVPLVLLYSRAPRKERRGFWDIVFGNPENPGLVRKLVSFIRNYSYAAIEVGEPVDLLQVQAELSQEPWERRKQVFELRRTLIESGDEIRRAVVGPQIKSKLELKDIILHHPKLEAFMKRRAKASGEPVWKIRKEADEYLEEIAADYSYTLIQLGERVLTWMWNNLFDGIDVDMESLHRVRKAARHNTLVYVPCHKSHIDYLILSYVLFRNNLYSPFIAAGKNLSFWPLGPIFRRGGAFFIRRTFKGARFYSEVFSLYVKTMVRFGHNIEFFIEGGRSRTGKMVLPKLGLLAILIQAVEEGFCDDLVFVPTSICYDRIPEEEVYVNEITGGAKKEESLGQLVRARRFLKKRYGRVYVRFAEPMSLRRYLERHRYDLKNLSSKVRHAMYRDFAFRIISNINQASLVTPHALVSAALLSGARKGTALVQLTQTIHLLFQYLEQNGVRFSRSFQNYDVVIEDTLKDLVKSKLLDRLKDEDDELEEEVFILDDDHRLTLEYYKNNIIHFFLPASFVATSILRQETFRFSLGDVLEDLAFMKDFFKYEFVYDMDVRDHQMAKQVLDVFERLAWLRSLEPAEDQPYMLTHRGLMAVQAFHGLIRNFFETYWLVLRSLRYVQKKPYTEKDLIKKVLSAGQKHLKMGLIERPESISKIVCGNALSYFVEKGLLERRVDESKGEDKAVEKLEYTAERQQVQYYSRQISRLLRAPHLALQ